MAGLLFTPLAWAALSLLLDFRWGRRLSWLGMLIQVLVSLALWFAVVEGGGFFYALGGWEAPLGIALRVDGLAVTFVLLTAAVATACGLHAGVYLDAGKPWQRYFWPLFWFLWAGLNGVWLGADLFNLYVALELISLAAVGLVALGGMLRPCAPRCATCLRPCWGRWPTCWAWPWCMGASVPCRWRLLMNCW